MRGVPQEGKPTKVLSQSHEGETRQQYEQLRSMGCRAGVSLVALEEGEGQATVQVAHRMQGDRGDVWVTQGGWWREAVNQDECEYPKS